MRETVFLNNDREMPLLGLGVYKLPDDVQAEAAITSAISAGYRMIDLNYQLIPVFCTTCGYVILPQFISACLIHGQCPQLIKYTQIITQNLPKCYNYSCWADSSILDTSSFSSSDAFCLFSFFSATLLSANLMSIPHI